MILWLVKLVVGLMSGDAAGEVAVHALWNAAQKDMEGRISDELVKAVASKLRVDPPKDH